MASRHIGRWLVTLAAAAVTLSSTSPPVDAAPQRSAAERAAFQRQNACPATGRHRGPCPGWEIDHVRPLCAGGPDRRENMQWLGVAAHREKSRADRRLCRNL